MELGVTYKDKITNVQGVAIGHCVYLTGCSQTLIQPVNPLAMDGTAAAAKADPLWMDDQRLTQVDGVERITLDNGATPGCDLAAPKI
jgi:hypothetical protein